MTDERSPAHQIESRHDERDSQLSAMFDDELPAGECELLARRLARDEALRSQWSRYSMIGAALRAERGVALHDRVALRVQAVVSRETTYGEAGGVDAVRTGAVAAAGAGSNQRRWARFGYPMAGAGIAAGVAAVSIVWLQSFQEPAATALQASNAPSSTRVLASEPAPIGAASSAAAQPASNGEPERYSTPAPSSSTSIAPPARLANYVVAHSEYSGPLQRRMALLGIVGAEGEPGADGDSAAPTDSMTAAEAGAQGDNGP